MKLRAQRRKTVVVLGIPALIGAQAAWGAVDTWSGATDNNWNTNSNWSASAPPGAADTAAFSSTSANTAITLGGTSQLLAGLSFTAPTTSYNIGITAGDTLNFASGGGIFLSTTPSQTISANISLGGSLVVTNTANTGAILDFAGNITGSQFVNTTGSGGHALYEFDGQNTFSGLNIANGNQYLIGSSSIYSGTMVTSGPLGSGTISSTNNPVFEAVGADRTIYNPLWYWNGAAAIQVANSTVGTAYDLTIAGPIVNNGGSRTVTVNNTGHTFFLGAASNPSTFTLSTTAGNLAFALTNGASLVINDVIQDATPAVADTISFNQVAGVTGYTVQVNGNSTYAGTTTFSASNSVFQIGLSSTMSGATVTSGPFGVGTLIPNNPNNPPYFEPHGADRILGNAISLANSGFLVANDASGSYNLTLAGPISLTTSSKTINNDMNSGVALTLGLSATPSTITLGNGATGQTLSFTTNNGSTAGTIVNDVIQNSSGGGAGSVAIVGGGPVYLNANNTYTGNTTVHGAGSGSSAVGTGGTLAGTGWAGTGAGTVLISGSATGSYGGIVSPGSAPATAGTLSGPSMQWNPYGRYIFEHNGTDTTLGGGVNDLISGSGTLDLTNLSASTPFDLNLEPLTSGDGNSHTYTIAQFVGGVDSGGASLANANITNDFTFTGNYDPSMAPDVSVSPDGENVLLTFIPASTPEPSSTVLLLGAAGVLVRRRRRRPQ